MNGSNGVIRGRLGLAIGVMSALIAVAFVGVAGASSAAQTPGPIKSGAGPGWPKTLSPSDFVSRVDSPISRSSPAASIATRATRRARG